MRTPEPIENIISVEDDRSAARKRLARRQAPVRETYVEPGYRVMHIPNALIFAVAALVFFAIVAFAGHSCAQAQVEAQQEEQGQAVEEQPQPEAVDYSQMPADLDPAVLASLKAQESDERVKSIVENASALAAEGPELQAKLLKLAAEDPKALDFVAGYAKNYPQESGKPYVEKLEAGSIPLLMQWDTRWGYVPYCGTGMGTTGCCPTSLSMVYMGLTGKTDKTPADLAILAEQNGYSENGQGTYSTFLTDMAPDVGLNCWQIDSSAESLTEHLKEGYPVVVNVGPGTFTDSGHFFVARGIAEDGTIQVNDPYSSVRSAQTWDAGLISSESIAMYACSL